MRPDRSGVIGTVLEKELHVTYLPHVTDEAKAFVETYAADRGIVIKSRRTSKHPTAAEMNR